MLHQNSNEKVNFICFTTWPIQKEDDNKLHCFVGHFRRYDKGLIGNKLDYGQFTPPDYNLTAITAPVHLIYGDNDWFADPEVRLIINSLCTLTHSVP